RTTLDERDQRNDIEPTILLLEAVACRAVVSGETPSPDGDVLPFRRQHYQVIIKTRFLAPACCWCPWLLTALSPWLTGKIAVTQLRRKPAWALAEYHGATFCKNI